MSNSIIMKLWGRFLKILILIIISYDKVKINLTCCAVNTSNYMKKVNGGVSINYGKIGEKDGGY